MNILAHIAKAKQAEYIIALLGLFGFIAFWRVLNGPEVGPETVRDVVRSLPSASPASLPRQMSCFIPVMPGRGWRAWTPSR